MYHLEGQQSCLHYPLSHRRIIIYDRLGFLKVGCLHHDDPECAVIGRQGTADENYDPFLSKCSQIIRMSGDDLLFSGRVPFG